MTKTPPWKLIKAWIFNLTLHKMPATSHTTIFQPQLDLFSYRYTPTYVPQNCASLFFCYLKKQKKEKKNMLKQYTIPNTSLDRKWPKAEVRVCTLAIGLHVYKNVLTVMIIRCKLFFVFFIFVVYVNHKNIFTTKISRSMVLPAFVLPITKAGMKFSV